MAASLTVAPQAEQEKGEAPALGVYLHVPFCATACEYCAFFQVRPEGDDLKKYLEDVDTESRLVPGPWAAETVFWGGGTPGLLPARHLATLAALLRSRLAAVPGEWTVEMAPTTATADRLAVLREHGVTRISLGVQSFQPGMLEALGRRHSAEQARRAYDRVRAAGFASVGLDLIFAVPGQAAAEWRRDLAAAVALAPDHLSTYCLTFEEDTGLFVRLAQGRVSREVEREASFYEATWEALGAAGYAQYEVSNFARPGHVCRHNLNTWRMQEWLGLGPSAASQFEGWRGANPADLGAWRRDLAAGQRATGERVRLTAELLAADALVFGLRCNAGVDLAALARRFPTAPWTRYRALGDRLVTDGLAERPTPGELRLTDRGRLVADAVGVEILAAAEPGLPGQAA